MFVVSVRPGNWRKILFWLLLAGAAFFLVSALFSLGKGAAARQTSAQASADTNEGRLAFLKSFGWEVSPEPLEVVDVIIPSEFGEVYKSYNDMQKQGGYDLTKYRSKQVKRYTYQVTNYPVADGEPADSIRANLLVYDGKIIGGDICSIALNGFMHGFKPED